MKEFKEGVRVKFLNELGSGVVSRIIDSDLVMVETDDGFEYPVLKSELLISTGDQENAGQDHEEETGIQSVDMQDEEDSDLVEGEDPGKESPLKQEYEASLGPKGIDKDSGFYRKAVKARERKIEKEKKGSGGIDEVDLQIGEILDNYSDLSPGEIVEVQLARFRTSLEGAIKAGQKRIVYIHGRGAGKLKRDIARIIDNEYPACQHQDASFAEYGYGATLILIK